RPCAPLQRICSVAAGARALWLTASAVNFCEHRCLRATPCSGQPRRCGAGWAAARSRPPARGRTASPASGSWAARSTAATPRARTRPPELALGELLLDQRVVAGIGNIWRSEALFLAGRNPWTERQKLTDDDLGALVATASSLMKASALGRGNGSDHWVYKRSGQPCRKCGTRIESRRLGEQARTAYWCPACQPV